jgi:hypothetical protein
MLVLAIAGALFSSMGQTQTKTKPVKESPPPPLYPLTDVLRLPWVAGTSVSGLIPVAGSNTKIADDFAQWTLTHNPRSDAAAGYLRRWYTESSELLQEVNPIHFEALAGYAYVPGFVPITVAQKDGAPVLLLTSLRGQYEYNTARTKESGVAATVVQSILIPVLRAITNHFREKPELQYYGAVVTYTIGNFVSKDDEIRFQTLCIVSPSKSAIAYVDLTETDAQLLRDSEFYLLSGHELRKTEVSLP